MINWSETMQQTFEFYIVDPSTWKDKSKLDNVTSCRINRDESNETLGSATIDCDSILDECYIRVYLVVIQNGETNKVPLGTFLVQTPSTDFDGKVMSTSLDAYTPLSELKDGLPPLGYSIIKDTEIMSLATKICEEHMRAPVVGTKSTDKLYDDFVSNTNDTWLSFVRDLIASAKYKINLDPMGRTIFEPIQDVASLQPVKIYDDDNSSILYPDISDERDLYGVPNVVEVVCSTDAGYLFSRVVNDDPNSAISTVNRGREVVYRKNNPDIVGLPSQAYLDTYAEQLLRNLSCLEHKITYKHGYCDVRVGDCVMLNYRRAGLNNVKAKVISQSITCETGCPVEETAIYTTKLWR